MMLRRFFQDYKTLEHKAVEVDDFEGAEVAAQVIETALAAYKQALPEAGRQVVAGTADQTQQH